MRPLALAIVLATAAQAADWEYPARHDHWRKGCAGLLKLDAVGVSFDQIGGKKPKHRLAWKFEDIQQLEVSDAHRVRVLSYRDRTMLAGKDQPFEFTLDGQPDLKPLYAELTRKLDQRFVARLADTAGTAEWRVPAKKLNAVKGSEGALLVYADRLVYESATPGASRTWRDADIRSVSTAGPFEFTLESFEQDGVFHFQLKEPLDAARYQALWLRLNRPKGLSLIPTTKEN